MRRWLCALALLALAAPALSRVESPGASEPPPRAPARARPLQSDCSERIGPFATQETAWANLREAEAQGYGVSGVFPCYDASGVRGYCFNVFHPC